jgi:hypothetical protein
VFYAQSEFKESPEKLKYLQSATEFALTCLEYRVDDAMELIAEVLESYPKFFEKKHLDLLWSAITGPWGMEIMKNLDAETVSLARIIVAYAEIPLESGRLYQEPDDPHHQEIMCKSQRSSISKLSLRCVNKLTRCSCPTRTSQISICSRSRGRSGNSHAGGLEHLRRRNK